MGIQTFVYNLFHKQQKEQVDIKPYVKRTLTERINSEPAIFAIIDPQVKQELIEILNNIKNRVKDTDDVVWSGFSTPQEVIEHINECIGYLNEDERRILLEIKCDFAPTAAFQELAIQNGWHDDYMVMSSRVDEIMDILRK